VGFLSAKVEIFRGRIAERPLARPKRRGFIALEERKDVPVRSHRNRSPTVDAATQYPYCAAKQKVK
jgi:hypothetical protein